MTPSVDIVTTQLSSAVRLASPDPLATRKRKASLDPSPSPPHKSSSRDVDQARAIERQRIYDRHQEAASKSESKPLTAEDKRELAKKEYEKLSTARSGGTYIAPHRLRELQKAIGDDQTSKEYQRMYWDALKKSINGIVNKTNRSSIKALVPELFAENLVRGRGLLCRSIMRSQSSALPFTPVFAALVAIINSKLPQVGELLLLRLVSQFRKAYKRSDKSVLLSCTTFIAHLCNQQVVHEIAAAQLLQLLLSNPTDDSVEIAVALTREVGQHLEEFSSGIANVVFDQFRKILHEGTDISKRCQYMIEVLFQQRKEKWSSNPAVPEDLDLIEEDDKITHSPPDMDSTIDTQDGLNIFKYDADFIEHEQEYKKLKAEILGEGDDDDSDADSEDSSDDGEEAQQEKKLDVQDRTNADLVNLRRTIYLTIQSAGTFEEAVHKLMRVNLPSGQESELISMVVESASQRPASEAFFGLIGERFAKLNRLWRDISEEQFVHYYEIIHRYETNRLRNVAHFFGHMLSTDAIGWHVLDVVHLNEEETNASSRIYIKIVFQNLVQEMGMKKLQERLRDPVLQPSLAGIFPVDNPRSTRFSINYFTSIGMGAVTEDMREHLKNMPKPAVPALPAVTRSESVSSASSYSSYSSYSDSRSRSRTRSPIPQRQSNRDRRRSPSASRSRSPAPRSRTRRGRSYTPSRSPSPAPRRSNRRSYSRSRTPPRTRRRSVSASISRSPSRSPKRRTAPARQTRRNSSSVRGSPPPAARRRRNSSSSAASVSPPPRRERSLSPYSARVAMSGGRGRGSGRGRGRGRGR